MKTLKTFYFLLIIFSFLSCTQTQKNQVQKEENINVISPNQDSELALLMREIFQYLKLEQNLDLHQQMKLNFI